MFCFVTSYESLVTAIRSRIFSSFKYAWQHEMKMFTRNTAGGKLEKKDFFLVFNQHSSNQSLLKMPKELFGELEYSHLT